jgi:hypothetical protein
MSPELKSGAVVRIKGETSWSVGRIEEMRKPEDLPEIVGAPSAELAAAILKEWQVTRIAIISHCGLIFAALETAEGWWDLNHQALIITPVERPSV